MSSRKKVRKDSPNVETRLANWLAQISNLLMTRFAYLILGRASSKTTEFQVERLIEMVYDMPGAPVCWVADTYSNLKKNVLSSLKEGLVRKGFIEGVHFVIERKPPEYNEAEKANLPKWLRDNFWKPYNQLASYKHTMIFFTGLNIRFGSLDRPASLAGPSYVHIFGDEVKYFREDRFLNLSKAVRGYFERFGHSVFYRGMTLTTDMPNPQNVGEYDWILARGKDMDPAAIQRVLQAGLVMNEAAQEYAAALESGTKEDQVSKKRVYERWVERWIASRLHKSAHRFFYIASSYVNVAYLNVEWFADAIKDAQGDLMTAVLSIKNSLSSGDRFYANLIDRHFYRDGTDPNYDDVFSLTTNDADCRELRKLNRKKKLELGMDFGNQNSMLIMQPSGKDLLVLKELYTLSPNWLRHLADDFLKYFEPMEEKTIDLYYDRAANNYKEAKQDLAAQIKLFIEKDEHGKSTGWKVNLLSRSQGNIPIHEEYTFMQEILSERNERLPRVRIDFYHCPCLRSSIQMAPTKKNRKGQIEKDKSSEKLPISRLPRESTNFSDAFKYGLMRKKWRIIAKQRTRRHIPDTSTH